MDNYFKSMGMVWDAEELTRMMVHVERDSDVPILDLTPHYTNSVFRNAQTVYMKSGLILPKQQKELPGVNYVYSDRVRSWVGFDAADNAWEEAKKSGLKERSAAFLEFYLRRVFDDSSLHVIHILAGFNLSNGYPYQVYGYTSDKVRRGDG